MPHARLALCLVSTTALAACGSLVGNSGPTTSGGTASASFIAPIDYAVPTSVSGYSLAEEHPDGLFQDSVKRFVGVVDRINVLTSDLNATVKAAGSYKGLGPDKKVDLVVTAQTGAYDYAATFCEGGKAFQYLEWSSTTGSVHAVRDYGTDPVDASRIANMTTDLVYAKGDTTTLRQRSYQIPPPNSPVPPGQNGANLGEIINSTRTAANSFTMSGVHNWVNDPSTLTAEGDEYFVGRFDGNGAGETVGYNVARKDACASAFDEATNNWCTGKDLAGTTYSGDTLAAAVARLKDIAVEHKADIVQPALPAGLTCP